jgi:predicted SnoaL-like aldol condensation-catalyzing enzyme
MSTKQNKAQIARWAAAYNEGNLAKLDQLVDEQCTEDYVLRDPNLVTGPAGLKQAVRSFVAGWSEMHVTIDEMIADGDHVASRWTVRGTSRSQQKEMTLVMLAISRFVEGKIAEEWVLAQPLEGATP